MGKTKNCKNDRARVKWRTARAVCVLFKNRIQQQTLDTREVAYRAHRLRVFKNAGVRDTRKVAYRARFLSANDVDRLWVALSLLQIYI